MSNLMHILQASVVRAGTLVDPADFYVIAERPDGEVKVNCKPEMLLKGATDTVKQIAMLPEVRAKMVRGFKYSGRSFFWLVKKYAAPRVRQKLIQYLDQALMISNPDPIVARTERASRMEDAVRKAITDALDTDVVFDPPQGSKIESGDRVMYVQSENSKMSLFQRLGRELTGSPRYGVVAFSPKPPHGYRVEFKQEKP